MADIVHLFAAGSLRRALTEAAEAFQTRGGTQIQARFGPSGLLKDEIALGERADVFASANMAHPLALQSIGCCGPVRLFARNTLCCLVTPSLSVDTDIVLDRMLDPTVKLGTSTPIADPSGDYALDVFRKADAVRPGAWNELTQKAQRLTGGADSAAPPGGYSAYGWHIDEGRADIFLAYRTACREAKQQYPALQIIDLPDTLAVGAEFGLAVVVRAPLAATEFADFILSAEGQDILRSHGFLGFDF